MLAVTPDGMHTLSNDIWGDLAKDDQGKVIVVAPSTDPDGLFYAAVSDYSFFHTCNAWVADRLHSTGLPISSDGVVFSGQVVGQVNDAVTSQCHSAGFN
jgi:hypothetical protein